MARIREAGYWTGGAPALWMARYLAGEHHPHHARARRIIYVAEEEGQMIGFIVGHLTSRFGCDGEMQWLYVVPERRGSGTAVRLLDSLATWFVVEDARRVCVNVEPENGRARRFYERQGACPLNDYWLVWPDVGEARTPRHLPAAPPAA